MQSQTRTIDRKLVHVTEARILIVDDDERLSDMVATYLRSRGFQVEQRIDGQGGVLDSPQWGPRRWFLLRDRVGKSCLATEQEYSHFLKAACR